MEENNFKLKIKNFQNEVFWHDSTLWIKDRLTTKQQFARLSELECKIALLQTQCFSSFGALRKLAPTRSKKSC
jgi:hypothetical protein